MNFDTIRVPNADDEQTFQSYKAGVGKAVREAFPSLSANFEPKLAGVRVLEACALMYTYMIALPDGKYAKVDFTVGGLPAPGTPVDREPTYRVESETFSSINS